MADDHNVTSNSGEGLNGLQVHLATLVDRFRDACRTGDLESVKHIVSDMPESDVLQLIHQPGYPGHEVHRPAVTGSPMFEAVLSNQVEVVDYIAGLGYDLEHECDVHVCFPIVLNDRCTALCLACACGAVDIARTLLRHGANVNHTSRHSSPIIYASEYNDVTLATLLLEHGADIRAIPQGLQSYTSVLPLYQACMNGHKDTAELFLTQSGEHISLLKRIGFLGLLGAQCINRHADFDSGIVYWRRALAEMRNVEELRNAEDLSIALQKFNLEGLPSVVLQASSGLTSDSPITNSVLTQHTRVFRDVHLCSSVEELEAISADHNSLILQALLVLQTILGPSHAETMLQVLHAARTAQEEGDLSCACRLYLHIMECSVNSGRSDLSTDYSSQLADLLLNVYCGHATAETDFFAIADISNLLATAIELICSTMSKMQLTLFPQSTDSPLDPAESKLHSRIRLFTEMVETLMAFLRLFVVTEQAGQAASSDVHIVYGLISRLLSLCHVTTPAFSKFSVESEMMKIAVHGDHSTLSTLYFFQEDLFPCVDVATLLLRCGASANSRDFQGDTPLHHAVDCRRPNTDVVRLLLTSGAHLDTCNRQGVTAETLLRRTAHALPAGIELFDLVTLRCLAARVVVSTGIVYHGGVLPSTLENFLSLHATPEIHNAVVGIPSH